MFSSRELCGQRGDTQTGGIRENPGITGGGSTNLFLLLNGAPIQIRTLVVYSFIAKSSSTVMLRSFAICLSNMGEISRPR